jgi:acetyltransferase-like isoleucine patch superfamily enzyme
VLFTREAAAVTGTHVFANREATILSQGVASADIVIEDDCWIGFRAILCPGSRVGRGTVVGAGAVVTKELPPMVVAGGVPARVIRQR